MSKKDEALKPEVPLKSKPPKNASFPTETGDVGSMEKIRDILFGNQVRDFERRFSQMEEHLNRYTAALRDELTNRLEALERFFKEELETLKGRIKKEADKCAEAGKRLNDDMRSSSVELTSAIQQVEDKLSERSTELRQQILQQSKELIGTIQSKQEQADRSLAQVAERLDGSKLDRASLAEYLVDIAMRLSDHQEIPAVGEADA
jgi:uncharacterized protein YydD (DUF2326 family)